MWHHLVEAICALLAKNWQPRRCRHDYSERKSEQSGKIFFCGAVASLPLFEDTRSPKFNNFAYLVSAVWEKRHPPLVVQGPNRKIMSRKKVPSYMIVEK